MDDLKRMVIFTHVVETGGFSAAAKRLGVAKSAISKHISLLEQHVGVRLLNRTTRSLSLTEVGESYYQSCVRIVEIADEARRQAGSLQEEPIGTLRVACPTSGVREITRLVNQFLQLYPQLKVDFLLNDHVVDMVQEGIDVAIRIGWLPDSSLRARKLKKVERRVCASPAYLEKAGTPTNLKQLAMHEWIILTLMPTPFHETFTHNGKEERIEIKGRIKTNNPSAIRELLLEGAGVAILSDFLLDEDIRQGKLIQLMPDYYIEEAGIYAVYQDQNYQQAKVRIFIDYLAKHMNLSTAL